MKKEMQLHEFEIMHEEYEERKDDGWIPTHHLRWLKNRLLKYNPVLQQMYVFRGSYEMTEWRDVPVVEDHSGYIDNDA